MIPWGTPVAKASLWKKLDTETRKLGERSRLETCVVLALNECLLAGLSCLRVGGLGEGNPLSRLPGEYGRKVETQRNWRGGTQLVEHVVQFETKRRTSPGFDISAFYSDESWKIRKEAGTGAAWLSSARSVRSALKWDNERNPHSVLDMSRGTALRFGGRKEGQTSSQHGPHTLGHTHVTMGDTVGLASEQSQANPQNHSQLGLGSATRPHEPGISSNRGSVTPR